MQINEPEKVVGDKTLQKTDTLHQKIKVMLLFHIVFLRIHGPVKDQMFVSIKIFVSIFMRTPDEAFKKDKE